jgi:hypothetical protein
VSDLLEGLFGLVMLAALFFGGKAAYESLHLSPAGEVEGSVKSEDCREQILTKEGAPETQGKRFICAYEKSQSGRLMGGLCVALEMEGKTCKAAYMYAKHPWIRCPEHSQLRADDQCWSEPGFHWMPGSSTVLIPDAPPPPAETVPPALPLDPVVPAPQQQEPVREVKPDPWK